MSQLRQQSSITSTDRAGIVTGPTRIGDEEDNEEETRFTIAAVDDTWKYVDERRDIDDRVVEFGCIPLADGELLPAGHRVAKRMY